MNIFALSRDPMQSAMEMCDTHVVKMILETAQLLSTAHRVVDGHEYTAQRKTVTEYTHSINGVHKEQYVFETPECYDELPKDKRAWSHSDGLRRYETVVTYRYVKRWRLPDNREKLLYKATHINHPCAVWARQTNNNYNWLYCHFKALCKEYTYRYGKIHLTEVKLGDILKTPPRYIEVGPLTPRPMAMPEEYKNGNVEESYRAYYRGAKASIAKWTKRAAPDWWLSTSSLAG